MKEEWEPKQSRATTHFKFYSEKYLWGSTRSELTPDERSVWVDFMCLATMNYGQIEVYSRDQLAQQLIISRKLLDRSINKFIKFGKIKKKYSKKEKKEVFSIKKWDQYQADYLKKRAKKSGTYEKKERIEKTEKSDTENEHTLQERKGNNITLQNTTLKEITEDDSEYLDPNNHEDSSPLPSNSESFNEGKNNLLQEYLSRLRDCPGYPFDDYKDSSLFHHVEGEYPGIDILKELDKKIAWWKKHLDALKPSASPRQKLCEWFEQEYEFQNRRD